MSHHSKIPLHWVPLTEMRLPTDHSQAIPSDGQPSRNVALESVGAVWHAA